MSLGLALAVIGAAIAALAGVGSGIGVFRVCQANNIAANPDVSASDLQADIDAYYVK